MTLFAELKEVFVEVGYYVRSSRTSVLGLLCEIQDFSELSADERRGELHFLS